MQRPDAPAAPIFELGGDSAAQAWRLLGPQMKAEIEGLRQGYGAKFNAITSALGYACEAQDKLEAGDDEAAGAALARVVSILADA